MDLLKSKVNLHLPEWDVKYGTVELAVSRMAPGSWHFVVDLADAFLNWKVADEDTLLLGFFSPARNQYGRYLYFPFGMKSAPAANDHSVKELLRLLDLNEGVVLTDFIDDLLGGAHSEREAWSKLTKVARFFLKCGVPVSDKPTGIRAPSQRQCWIGWVFDTVQGSLSVDEAKCTKHRER